MTNKQVKKVRKIILFIIIAGFITFMALPYNECIGDIREIGGCTQVLTPRGEWENSGFNTQPSIEIYKMTGVYGMKFEELSDEAVSIWETRNLGIIFGYYEIN